MKIDQKKIEQACVGVLLGDHVEAILPRQPNPKEEVESSKGTNGKLWFYE